FPSLSLVESGHASLVTRGLASTREHLSRSLAKALPEPEQGVAQALLLGNRAEVEESGNADFRDTGTSHLLAISGLHVGVLIAMALLVSRRFLWRWPLLAALPPLLLAWGYAALAGMPPSAERAAIMGSAYLAAWALGRQRHGLTALMLAALLITIIDPRALWQVSFQLSFAAMLGIVLVLPLIQERLYGGALDDSDDLLPIVARWLLASIAVSIAATLFTIPLVAFYFHRVSLVGIPSTVFALPALPLALVSSLFTALIGLASSHAAWVFGWLAWLSVGWIVWVVQAFAAVPFASISVAGLGRWLVGLYYTGLATGILGWQRLRTRLQPSPLLLPEMPRVTRFAALATALIVAAVVLWAVALQPSQRLLEAEFIDVGHGDSILIHTPSRHTLLVDGGTDPRPVMAALGEGSPLHSKRIDLVVMTHPQQDHGGGLIRVLERYNVKEALDPELVTDSALATEWEQTLEREGIPRMRSMAGEEVIAGNLHITVLHPPDRPLGGTDSDLNNNGIVMRLEYGDISFLLTADIEAVAEGYLVDHGYNLHATVLKAAHHGSTTSSSGPFLRAVQPRVAVISAGNPDPFGHPSPQAIAALRQYLPDSLIFNTAQHGNVMFETDGKRLWVKTQR
ncbi:MAG: DNA internalization-related competence protein ComEC/Rec2, partial [Chloroflexi bacterium]|nr:DNA internalization-related competence protein ComEC/Rec2 [Chloroflexota bacterium]